MNSQDLKLGQLLPNTWQHRDAVHVAVIPLEAGERLIPGSRVGLDVNGKAVFVLGALIGVVDPFLNCAYVERGECFWLFLYPGSITNLQHDWFHPAFPQSFMVVTEAEKAESEAWLREFFGAWPKDGDYDTFVDMYRAEISNILAGKGATIYGHEQREAPPELWFHIERLTGRQVPSELRESTYFDCRC